MKISTVIGTRPEIIKMSLLIPLLDKRYDHGLIYSGQHFSPNMKEIFFDDLVIRKPNYSLNSHSSNYSKLIEEIQPCLEDIEPSYVIVYGDTNSTVAGAVVAKRTGSKLVHLEAGLRSFDIRMVEEKNRTYVDSISDYLLAPTDLAKSFLMSEGYKNISVTGNPIVDVVLSNLSISLKRRTREGIDLDGEFLLATLHRQENVDNPYVLNAFTKHLESVGKQVVFPVHPRTKNRLTENNIQLPKNVKMVDALGFLDFINLLYHSSLVLTDSGGIQEEAITLKKPCITLRESTERWETILLGVNRLFPLIDNQKSLGKEVEEMQDGCKHIRNLANPYGEVGVSEKIAETLKGIFE